MKTVSAEKGIKIDWEELDCTRLHDRMILKIENCRIIWNSHKSCNLGNQKVLFYHSK